MELFYIPEVDKFVIAKSSINGVSTFTERSLSGAIQRFNRLCEGSFTDESDRRDDDILEYVIRGLG